MLKGFFNVPKAVNEPVKSYAPGSVERTKVAETYKTMWNASVEVPLYIGSEEIKTGNTKKMTAPHDHQHVVGIYHQADRALVEKAITSALEARKKWAAMAWENRASIFLKIIGALITLPQLVFLYAALRFSAGTAVLIIVFLLLIQYYFLFSKNRKIKNDEVLDN